MSPDLARAHWRVSARTNGANTCVEASTDGVVVAVRNSTAPDGPALTVPTAEWLDFLDHVAAGQLDTGTLGTPTPAGPFLVGRAPDGLIELRSAREPELPAVRYTPAEWDVFVAGVTEDSEFTLAWLLRGPGALTG